jgi:ABC-2 type transport system ATP-binding protein
VIVVEGLTRRFGDLTAVEGLTLSVAEGEVLGLLGPNGAGKTTTVRMLACLIGVTSGTATVGGHSVTDRRQAGEVRALVGLAPEDVGLYGELTPVQTLDFFGRLYGLSPAARRRRTDELLARLRLDDARDRRVATFSKGMKQRLALARALVHDPPVLLLDEPTANLDPEGARDVREMLLALREDHRTIVLNTHHLEDAQRVCDRVAILDTRLVALGTPDQLRASVAGRRTVIRLVAVTPAVTDALAAAGFADVEVDGPRLSVAVADPERDTPDLVAAVVAAGGRVRDVGSEAASLEDTYLAVLRGERP